MWNRQALFYGVILTAAGVGAAAASTVPDHSYRPLAMPPRPELQPVFPNERRPSAWERLDWEPELGERWNEDALWRVERLPPPAAERQMATQLPPRPAAPRPPLNPPVAARRPPAPGGLDYFTSPAAALADEDGRILASLKRDFEQSAQRLDAERQQALRGVDDDRRPAVEKRFAQRLHEMEQAYQTKRRAILGWPAPPPATRPSK